MSTNSGKILDVDPWVGASLLLLLLRFVFKGQMSASDQIACSAVVKKMYQVSTELLFNPANVLICKPHN